ncbi:MAG: glycoside hydrolase family 9 protein [Saprospiraceae bacterium]
MKAILFLILFSAVSAFANPPAVSPNIKTDQFGYRCNDRKIAVISNPVIGYNSNLHFSPALGPNQYELRRMEDDQLVYSGTLVAWNGGGIHAQSGDEVWWFDFSEFSDPGTYYIFDVVNQAGSYTFDIGDQVYAEVLKQAMRAFYYQRCGAAKVPGKAETGWTDQACHIGNLQDKDCRLYNDNSPSTSKDLSGGWHDAGDYNKYVNFTFEPMLDLLLAYEQNPIAWKDDYNIPESGNGVADLLDEVKYELEWLLRMQNADGSVLSLVGVADFASASPPSADAHQRVYGPETTSATFTASGIFALAAIQFAAIGQTTFAQQLQTAAIAAYDWATANPGVMFYNSGLVGAGEQEIDAYETSVRQIVAAIFLFAQTGNVEYKDYVEAQYSFTHLMQWSYAYPFEASIQNALLYYANLPSASSEAKTAIQETYENSMGTDNEDNLPAYLNHTDAYGAYMSDNNYTWGSHTTKGRQGIMFTNMIANGLDPVHEAEYRAAALGFVNYFHGVNPTGFAFLTNMAAHGAENSVNEIYHSWFTDGSDLWDRVGTSTYGPAPGFVPGGVNPTYSVDGCCPNNCGGFELMCNPDLVTPPLNQPVQKSYRDWNGNWPQNSWTVTEIGIYTQAAYVRLLSHFVDTSTCGLISKTIEEVAPAISLNFLPNPFRNSTDLYFSTATSEQCKLEVFNSLGQLVETQRGLTNQAVSVGHNLPAGNYVVKASLLSGPGRVAIGRMVKN